MRQRNIVFKTIFITFGVALILAIAVFGIVSLAAPATMMRFTDSLGLTQVSGDYAFQEYERSGSMECLTRSFIISAERKRYSTAEERFQVLYEDEKEAFEAYCAEQDEKLSPEGEEGDLFAAGTYRAYICGLASRVKYHLAKTEEEKAAVITFALNETDKKFPAGNPAIALATEAAKAEDKDFCSALISALEGGEFENTADLTNVIGFLRQCAEA